MLDSYQGILRQALVERTRTNPRYSMRSLARDLDLAPSTLSQILSGKKGLSAAKAEKVARALRLPDWKARRFQTLVAKKHARRLGQREKATRELEQEPTAVNVKILKSETAEALTSPFDLGILEATYLQSFRPSLQWLSERLGISRIEARLAVERLIRVGLLEAPAVGEWKDLAPFFSTTDGLPSRAIRRFQQAVLKLMANKLAQAPVGERTMKTLIFSIAQADVVEANNILDEALQRVLDLSAKPAAGKDHVLCFSAQLFYLIKARL